MLESDPKSIDGSGPQARNNFWANCLSFSKQFGPKLPLKKCPQIPSGGKKKKVSKCPLSTLTVRVFERYLRGKICREAKFTSRHLDVSLGPLGAHCGTEKPWQPETWQDSALFSPRGKRAIFSAIWYDFSTCRKKGGRKRGYAKGVGHFFLFWSPFGNPFCRFFWRF